jgi:hypothetical protein
LKVKKIDAERQHAIGDKKSKHKCWGCAAGFVFMILFFVRRNITRALDYLPPAAFRFCGQPAAPSRVAGPP